MRSDRTRIRCIRNVSEVSTTSHNKRQKTEVFQSLQPSVSGCVMRQYYNEIKWGSDAGCRSRPKRRNDDWLGQAQ